MPSTVHTHWTPNEREDALRDAVEGLKLNADQERTLSWLALQPTSAVTAICDIFEGLRAIPPIQEPEEPRSAPADSGAVVSFSRAGNSGPGW